MCVQWAIKKCTSFTVSFPAMQWGTECHASGVAGRMWLREKSSNTRRLTLKQPPTLQPWIPVTLTGCWRTSQIKGRMDHVIDIASVESHAWSWMPSSCLSWHPITRKEWALQGKFNTSRGAEDVILTWVSSLGKETWRTCPVALQERVTLMSLGITCTDLWRQWLFISNSPTAQW